MDGILPSHRPVRQLEQGARNLRQTACRTTISVRLSFGTIRQQHAAPGRQPGNPVAQAVRVRMPSVPPYNALYNGMTWGDPLLVGLGRFCLAELAEELLEADEISAEGLLGVDIGAVAEDADGPGVAAVPDDLQQRPVVDALADR